MNKKNRMIIFKILICILMPLSCNSGIRSSNPEYYLTKSEVSTHLRFLASDELKGRKTGSAEAGIAARYIAEQFRSAGLKSFSNTDSFLQKIKLGIKGNNIIHASDSQIVTCNNVIGYIEGTDPELKDEYILLIAHYDHLGILSRNERTGTDSIYNGARDNGVGTIALISAAKALAEDPPARSVIFIASTGEEEGMLGSKYFIKNPLIELQKIVFTINCDGGGYNDTTIIRIGGLNRTSVWQFVTKGAKRYGLTSLPYPDELEYLFYLSDSSPFTQIGIPAITISQGFDKIDEEILKYIHTTADKADDSFNYSYLLKFCKIYIAISRMVADSYNVHSTDY